jgi:hypothetical protein
VLFDALFLEFFCRTTNFWFLALIFLRKDASAPNLSLLIPKPLRLVIIRTGMKPKVLWREVTPLCRLLLPSLKLKVLSDAGRITTQLETLRGRYDEPSSKSSLSKKPRFIEPVGKRQTSEGDAC